MQLVILAPNGVITASDALPSRERVLFVWETMRAVEQSSTARMSFRIRYAIRHADGTLEELQ